MIDYLTFGSAPSDETCVQVSKGGDYIDAMKRECQKWKAQLVRFCGDSIPDGCRLAVKSFPNDFGTYYEVCAVFDNEDAEGVRWAFSLDESLPSEWDDEASPGRSTGTGILARMVAERGGE